MSEQERSTAARDALVASLIGYGVQIAILVGFSAVVSRRYWLEHARWRFGQWRTKGERAESAALAELRADISRIEHGGAMPRGGPTERGLYGGLR